MSRNTLIGFVLIGLVLLFWPTYLDIVFPEEKTTPPQEEVLPAKTSSPLQKKPLKKVSPENINREAAVSSEFEEAFFEIETSLYSAVVSNKNGGSISSFVVRDHLKDGEDKIQLIDTINQNNLLVSFINDSGEEIFLEDFWSFASSLPKKVSLVQDDDFQKLSFYIEVGGALAKKSLTFKNNSYSIDVDVDIEDLETIILDNRFKLQWTGGVRLTENSKQESLFLEGLVSQNGSIQSYRVGSASLFGGGASEISLGSKQYSGNTDFVGYRTKYFGVFFVPQRTDEVEITKGGSSERPEVGISTKQEINLRKTTLFFGPLEYEQVSSLGVGLEDKILGWQWLSSISWLVYATMVFLYGIVPNYGVVVILFAVLIKAATYPLMAKQLRSSKKMQEIQPELNKIKTKYKHDPALQQQKMAALFQESGVNPLAGCLPMLIQFPVLIAVFMVFRNTIEFRGESFFLWISDLASPDTLFVVGSIPIHVLPFLMSISMYYTMQSASAGQVSGDPAQEATQKMMKYMFPGMMFFLFYGFPSGLNLYYFCFNVIQLVQQKIINNEK